MLSADGDVQVGKISKQWSGMAKEVFTDADSFGVTFPLDLDVKMKATLLGAVFLIVSTLTCVLVCMCQTLEEQVLLVSRCFKT